MAKNPLTETSLDEEEKRGSDSERSFSVLLPSQIAEMLEHISQTEAVPVERLLQNLLTEYVNEKCKPLEERMHRVNELINELVVQVKETLMQTCIAGTGIPASFDERKRKRDRMVELGMKAFEELSKIAESEAASRESGFRLEAFKVVARLGMFNAALIRDQETEDLKRLIEELEEDNEELRKTRKKVEAKGK